MQIEMPKGFEEMQTKPAYILRSPQQTKHSDYLYHVHVRHSKLYAVIIYIMYTFATANQTQRLSILCIRFYSKLYTVIIYIMYTFATANYT